MAPKVSSAAAMACAAALLPVASTVHFSSTASLFGAPGQANYAAANAALEANSLTVTSRGVPSTTVQWGAWAAGMANAHTQLCISHTAASISCIMSIFGCPALLCAATHPLFRVSTTANQCMAD